MKKEKQNKPTEKGAWEKQRQSRKHRKTISTL
jgi:hypothetical protein